MCFVCISEQTATCATYSINWLVFITEMKSVYSAVRTGSLNKALFDESALKILFRNNGITPRFHAVAKSFDLSWFEIIITAVAYFLGGGGVGIRRATIVWTLYGNSLNGTRVITSRVCRIASSVLLVVKSNSLLNSSKTWGWWYSCTHS